MSDLFDFELPCKEELTRFLEALGERNRAYDDHQRALAAWQDARDSQSVACAGFFNPEELPPNEEIIPPADPDERARFLCREALDEVALTRDDVDVTGELYQINMELQELAFKALEDCVTHVLSGSEDDELD